MREIHSESGGAYNLKGFRVVIQGDLPQNLWISK